MKYMLKFGKGDIFLLYLLTIPNCSTNSHFNNKLFAIANCLINRIIVPHNLDRNEKDTSCLISNKFRGNVHFELFVI